MHKKKLFHKWTLTFILFALALLMIFPIAITFTNSFMMESEINLNYGLIGQITDPGAEGFINLKLIPDWVSFGQFAVILIHSPRFLGMFWNSVWMVAPIIIGQTVVAAFAAYAFSMLRFPGRDILFLVYIIAMLMPFQVTLVPNYIIADKLGLLNTTAAIILPGIFATYGVFLLRQFFMQVPGPLMEAAKIDGAGHLRSFYSIVLPLVKPGFAALIVLLFVDYWNMVEQPLIFLEDTFKYPLSLYLAYILRDNRGVAFASSLLYMSPIVLLFLYAEAYFIKGVQSSGIKG